MNNNTEKINNKKTSVSTEKMTIEKMEKLDEFFVKPSELADVLRVSEGTIYSLIDQNVIPSQKYGKSIRIKRIDALQIIKEGICIGVA